MAQDQAVGRRSEGKLCIGAQKRHFFWEQKNKALIAQTCTLNGEPYVGLSKFWRLPKPKADPWAPDKKSHLYLTIPQWTQLLTIAATVTTSLEQLRGENSAVLLLQSIETLTNYVCFL